MGLFDKTIGAWDKITGAEQGKSTEVVDNQTGEITRTTVFESERETRETVEKVTPGFFVDDVEVTSDRSRRH